MQRSATLALSALALLAGCLVVGALVALAQPAKLVNK